MRLRDAFVVALVGAAIAAPLVFREQFPLLSIPSKDVEPAAAAVTVGKGEGASCNSSCQNGVIRLVNAFNDYLSDDYDDRKRGREARSGDINQKGLSVVAMLESRINNRPAFIYNMPA